MRSLTLSVELLLLSHLNFMHSLNNRETDEIAVRRTGDAVIRIEENGKKLQLH